MNMISLFSSQIVLQQNFLTVCCINPFNSRVLVAAIDYCLWKQVCVSLAPTALESLRAQYFDGHLQKT